MFIFKNTHLLESKEGIDSNTDKCPRNPASQNPLGNIYDIRYVLVYFLEDLRPLTLD